MQSPKDSPQSLTAPNPKPDEAGRARYLAEEIGRVLVVAHIPVYTLNQIRELYEIAATTHQRPPASPSDEELEQMAEAECWRVLGSYDQGMASGFISGYRAASGPSAAGLVEALEFYACRENWTSKATDPCIGKAIDRGEHARMALAKYRERGGTVVEIKKD